MTRCAIHPAPQADDRNDCAAPLLAELQEARRARTAAQVLIGLTVHLENLLGLPYRYL